jgi:hypothetical protein
MVIQVARELDQGCEIRVRILIYLEAREKGNVPALGMPLACSLLAKRSH